MFHRRKQINKHISGRDYVFCLCFHTIRSNTAHNSKKVSVSDTFPSIFKKMRHSRLREPKKNNKDKNQLANTENSKLR